MASPSVTIEKLITVDEYGMPKAPTVRQLQDKDVVMLWSRDTTSDKSRYLKDCGVIYYLGDPKSPVRQRGLSDDECLKEARENYDLPREYTPDKLVKKLIEKYHIENITEAGVALQSLQRSVHLLALASNKMNEILAKKIINLVEDEEIQTTLTLMNSVGKMVNEIPSLTKALGTAYENLKNEEEESFARGGKVISSSMDADEDTI